MTAVRGSGRLVVWGVAGGLGQDSLNRRLLRAIAALAPDDIEVRICELLPHLPLFDEDGVGWTPPAVGRLYVEVADADAIIVATNDLNGGVPGVLKNALDWLSVPEGRAAVQGRPVALMGAFPEEVATVRSHADLRSIFTSLDALVLPPPWPLLDRAEDHLGDDDVSDATVVALAEQLFVRLRQSAHRPRSTSASSDPDAPEPATLAMREDQRRQVLEFLQANLGRAGLDVGGIARGCGMSTRTLQRLFADAEAVLDPPDGVASRGVMFVLRGLRVEHAAGLLIARPSRPLHAVLRASGFTSPSTFHRAFREFTGLTPNEYRRQWVPQAEQTEVGA